MEFYLGIIFFLIGGVGLIQEVNSFKRKEGLRGLPKQRKYFAIQGMVARVFGIFLLLLSGFCLMFFS